MSLSVKYSWAISERTNERGLKLARTEGISGALSVVLLQDPQCNTQTLRIRSASSGHFDRAC